MMENLSAISAYFGSNQGINDKTKSIEKDNGQALKNGATTSKSNGNTDKLTKQTTEDAVSTSGKAYELSISYEKNTYTSQTMINYSNFSTGSFSGDSTTDAKSVGSLAELLEKVQKQLEEDNSHIKNNWAEDFAEKLNTVLRFELGEEILSDEEIDGIAQKAASLLYDHLYGSDTMDAMERFKQTAYDILKGDGEAEKKLKDFFNSNNSGGYALPGAGSYSRGTSFSAYQYTEVTHESFNLELSIAA